MKVYVNGALVPEAEAVLPVSDHGLTVGDGLFETMKVVDGTPFALGRHLARLERTAAGLGLVAPDAPSLRAAVESTIAANGPEVGRVRVTVTGGHGPAGTSRGSGPSTVLVQCSTATTWPATAKVVTVPWPRNERGVLAGLKTTSYADNVIAYAYAVERGGEEAIFSNTQDNLCEGTGTNVFVVVDGRLVTPPLRGGCLAGVTRELLLEVDPTIDEADVSMATFETVEEAFLTSSTRDVQPIATIDGRTLAKCNGSLTTSAAAAFFAISKPARLIRDRGTNVAQLIEFAHLAQKYRRPVTGVLHVGAHLGEEAAVYAAQGVSDVVWVEGNPDLIRQLTENVEPYGHTVIEGLVSDTDGTPVEFNIANNGYSSSLLELGTHTTAHPDVFFTETKHLVAHRLDTLLARADIDHRRFNYLCLDLQGAELMCLQGAPDVLTAVDYIYTEVNEDELYIGCARLPDLDAFLSDFRRVETEMAEGKGWGEAIYVRREPRLRRWFDVMRRRR